MVVGVLVVVEEEPDVPEVPEVPAVPTLDDAPAPAPAEAALPEVLRGFSAVSWSFLPGSALPVCPPPLPLPLPLPSTHPLRRRRLFY